MSDHTLSLSVFLSVSISVSLSFSVSLNHCFAFPIFFLPLSVSLYSSLFFSHFLSLSLSIWICLSIEIQRCFIDMSFLKLVWKHHNTVSKILIGKKNNKIRRFSLNWKAQWTLKRHIGHVCVCPFSLSLFLLLIEIRNYLSEWNKLRVPYFTAQFQEELRHLCSLANLWSLSLYFFMIWLSCPFLTVTRYSIHS